MPHELMGFWLSGPGAEAGTEGQAGTDGGTDGGGAHAAATRRSVPVTGIAPSSLMDTSRIPPLFSGRGGEPEGLRSRAHD